VARRGTESEREREREREREEKEVGKREEETVGVRRQGWPDLVEGTGL
jgi:hypothetical protein